jgi:hypothetical protein
MIGEEATVKNKDKAGVRSIRGKAFGVRAKHSENKLGKNR